jgi:putative NIF3 family GTP cyclohydrolase 1 type 2
MYTARDVALAMEAIAPLSLGNSTDELGFLHGDPQTPARGVACVWNLHTPALRCIVARGLNVVVTHELPFMASQQSAWYDGPQRPEDVIANQKRLPLIEQHQLVIYRAHSNWDALPDDGVPDQAVAALGLPGVRAIGGQKYFRVHELPQPITVTQLAEHVQQGLGMPWFPRVFGDHGRHVQRFAFLIGGFGGNLFHMAQAAHALGAEVVIIGEQLEWFTMAALECGLPVIETLHSLSEIPAIRRQTEMLRERLPSLAVEYVDSGVLGYGPAQR